MKIEDELEKFKQEVKTKYKTNEHNFIYLRLSKLDNSLDKEERITDALNKLRSDFNKLLEMYNNLREEGFYFFVEVKSAYKDTEREEFIKLYENHLFGLYTIRDILENKHLNNSEPKNLYIASFDRLSRVFFYSLLFQLVRKIFNVNVFSLLEEERQFEIRNKDVLEEENLKQTMFVFQLMMFSSMASKHSEDLSNKIKKRVSKINGVTISSKTGAKWGAKQTISDNMRAKIKERYNKFTYKEISEQSDIYQKVKGKKKPISINTIIKIIKE